MKTKITFLITTLLLTIAISCTDKINKSDPGTEVDPKPDVEYKILSFSILKKDNPSLNKDIEFSNISGNKFCAYLDNIKDASSLIATFKLSKGELLVGDIQQESGKTANDFTKAVTYKYKRDDGKVTEWRMTLVPYTGMPLLLINAENGEMPENKVDWKKASMKIIDIDGDFDCSEIKMDVRLRGNSTMSYSKKPFNIKLSEKTSLLGMPKHKRWSLLANYRDRSLLRNSIAFHIGQSLNGLDWTSRSKFVEVIFNGEYLGNYQLTEDIRVDQNRVNIEEMTISDIEGSNLTGGYLLEVDKRFDEVNKFKTKIIEMPVSIKAPDEDVLQKKQFEYIANYFNCIEKLMVESDFKSVYDEYLDINSLIDCWFAYEIPANTEISGQYSCYFYKKRNGKLFAGPIWDYDYAFNFRSSNLKAHSMGHPWFALFLKDPIFLEAARKRFNEIKPVLMTIPDFIESQREYMRLSSVQNEKLWAPRTGYIGNKDEKMSYDESIDYLISFCKQQIEWMDAYLNK